MTARLGRLSRSPFCFLERPEQQRQSENVSYKHQVYTRTAKADQLLIDRGELDAVALRPFDTYNHRLLIDIVNASIEIGCADGYEFIAWHKLLAAGVVPEQTWRAKSPHAIPAGEAHVLPDGAPFAIRRGNLVRFCLLEVDRDTTDITGKSKSAIDRKLRKYAEMFEARGYKAHYGFGNCLVLFVTVNEPRRRSIEAWVARELGSPKWLCLKVMADCTVGAHFPKPHGFMLSESWSRVGNPPLNLGDF
ncbi:MAG: hypothetical protein ABL982_23225 [Vicinamibacterales bacterium]